MLALAPCRPPRARRASASTPCQSTRSGARGATTAAGPSSTIRRAGRGAGWPAARLVAWLPGWRAARHTLYCLPDRLNCCWAILSALCPLARRSPQPLTCCACHPSCPAPLNFPCRRVWVPPPPRRPSSTLPTSTRTARSLCGTVRGGPDYRCSAAAAAAAAAACYAANCPAGRGVASRSAC